MCFSFQRNAEKVIQSSAFTNFSEKSANLPPRNQYNISHEPYDFSMW